MLLLNYLHIHWTTD